MTSTVRSLAPAAARAFLAGVAAVVGSYAAAGFTPAFVVAPVESVLASVTPGAVVTFAITVLGDLGQQLALFGAVALAVTLYASIGLLATVLADRTGTPVVAPLVGGTVAYGVTLLSTGAVLYAFGAAVPFALALVLPDLLSAAPVDGVSGERRQVLGTLAAVGSFVGLGLVAGRARTPGPVSTEGVADEESRALLREAGEKSLDVEGLEPLVSERFYEVDINSVDPQVSSEEWTLSVTGAVDEAFEIDYADLTARESYEEFATLRCVGEQLNGKKMDNALWTVTDVEPILEEAGAPDSCCVMLRAADDYFEEFPREALRDAKLAYRMNGKPLPRGHGHPVRALVPGHWGEINVKWVTEIEILEEPADGYWEKRGWHGTGPVVPVAKIHALNRRGNRVEVAGHAYAGTRGVSRVEVSTDGGSTWSDARLSEPLAGEDVWRQWVYEYDHPGERHEVVARMYDDEGRVQPKEQRKPFPRGPSGWVSRTVD